LRGRLAAIEDEDTERVLDDLRDRGTKAINKFISRIEGRVTTSSEWTPIWVLPNVTIDRAIEASHAALAPVTDPRLRAMVERKPALGKFLLRFKNEFGSQLWPTVGMIRQDAPQLVKTVAAFGAVRDAVLSAAVIAGYGLTMKFRAGRGILYSEAFDVYPWFPTPDMNGNLTTLTPALGGWHHVDACRPQSAPALGNTFLETSQIDEPLWQALVARWEERFVLGSETTKDRRLFRAIEMARAASKTPGGRDANEHHAGRSVALWVSAFEILAHDGKRADFELSNGYCRCSARSNG
jgi:hypothetical protein